MPKRSSKEKGIVQPSNTNMVCVVPKQNVEIFGRALHSLSRIGEELYLEPVDGGLTFRTVHSNHSVYAEVHFTNQFFSYYNCPVQSRGRGQVDDDAEALKCRINMKSYLAAFRSLPCVRKQVETCLLQIEPTWLMIKFRCHHSLIRTYRLPVIETETLQALYTVDEVPNHLIIGADVFATAVKNFQATERDITLAVEEQAAVLRNYVPGGTDPTGVVRSELKLDAGEFISFTIGQPTAITFCLKSFRAVLFFSEPSNLPLAVKFSSPGSPVVIMSDSSTVELRFVLSSLAPEDCDTSRNESQQLTTPLQSLEGREKEVQLRKRIERVNVNPCSLDEAWEGTGDARSHQPAHSSKINNKIPLKPSLEANVVNHRTEPSQSNKGMKKQQELSRESQESAATSLASSTRAVVGAPTASSGNNWGKRSHLDSFESSFNSKGPTRRDQCDIVIPASDDEDDDDDVVPASPPPPVNKRARTIFQRCFDPTLTTEALVGEKIYVPDSDEED